MASVARVNGFGNYVVGTYRTTANIGAVLVTVKNAAAAAQDIRAEDDGANEVVEAIMRAVQPIGANFADANTGVATLLYDASQTNAAGILVQIHALGTAVGPNNIDVTGTTCTEAATLTAT